MGGVGPGTDIVDDIDGIDQPNSSHDANADELHVPHLGNLPTELGKPNDLWVALEVAEDLLAERAGDLGVYPSVLDVTVPEVVGDIFDSLTGVEKVDGDRVAERVNRAP